MEQNFHWIQRIQRNLRNNWNMNCNQYEDLLCHPCLCGTVESPLSLTQEILRSNPAILLFYYDSFASIQQTQWKHLGKTQISLMVGFFESQQMTR